MKMSCMDTPLARKAANSVEGEIASLSLMILYQMLLDALVYEEQFSNYDGLGMGDASAYDERFWSFGDYGGDGDGGVRRVGMGVRVGAVM